MAARLLGLIVILWLISFVLFNTCHAAPNPGSATIALQYLPGVPNQGPTNTCVSWTEAWAVSYLENRRHHTHLLLSPSYPYDWAEGGFDNGSNVSPMTAAINAHGIPLWTDFHPSQPERESDVMAPWLIPSRVTARALHPHVYVHILWEGAQWNVEPIQRIIAWGRPVLLAVNAYRSFLWQFNAGQTVTPGYGGYIFQHELLVIGYSNVRHAFLAENWWGQSNGVDRTGTHPGGGYVWLSYHEVQVDAAEAAYLTTNPLAHP